MIKPLRRRHLLIWRTLAILLPAGIIIGWLSIPKKVYQYLLQPEIISPLPVVLKKFSNSNYSVLLRTDRDTSSMQLEWENKNILQYPSATIYATGLPGKDVKEAKLVGRIEARGTWHFPLDSSFRNVNKYHFILYDFIHQQVIDTLTLLP
jgi:hypothetical protein